jgi:hypothetical protein
MQSSPRTPFIYCANNAPNEVSDNIDLINVVIIQLDTGRLFKEDHQIKTLKPIGAKVPHDMRLVVDSFDIDIELIRDNRADVVAAQVRL